jgi:hypothetical protein
MRPRTATIGSVSFNVSKKKSLPWGPHAAGAGSSLDHTEEGRDSPTTPTRKTSLFDSFRPRSKSDATRKLSHRRVPMVRPDLFSRRYLSCSGHQFTNPYFFIEIFIVFSGLKSSNPL